MPKVSVIIPTYNRSYEVCEAIVSVLKQTMSDLEVIIVDDGSTDDTADAVKSINDDRLVYLYKANSGVSGARNYGLKYVKGDYVAFLDSDDYWPSDYLENVLPYMENHPEFDGVYTPVTAVYPDGRELKSYKRPSGKSGWIHVDLFQRSFIWPSASIFRSVVWQDFRFDEQLGNSSEDSDAFLRLSLQIQYGFTDKVESYHFINPEGLGELGGVNFNRVLSLERFYFRLGGDEVIPSGVFRKRISHVYRKLAENRRKTGNRSAALGLYKRAIGYCRYDIRLYVGLVKAILMSRSEDSDPDWKMPKSLALNSQAC